MSRSRNADRQYGKDYWNRRPFAGCSVGGRHKVIKKLTHAKERTVARRELAKCGATDTPIFPYPKQ